MGDDDSDNETCAEKMKKCRSTVANYGGAFFAIALAFVAFDAAYGQAPMKDPKNWVKTLQVDIWFGPSPHFYGMLLVLAAAASASFITEIVCLLLFYGMMFRILKFGSLVKLAVIVLFVLPVCFVGIGMAFSGFGVAKSPEKIDGPLFDYYNKYKNLVDQSKNKPFTWNLGDELEKAQKPVDWLQQDYHCCGINSVDDWKDHLDPNLTDWTNKKPPPPARLQFWWTNENNSETLLRLPKSCCSVKHGGYCLKSDDKIPCKKQLVELLSRCIIFSSCLLLTGALCGIVGSISFYRASKSGIAAQERYHAWLVKTGQLNTMDDD